MEFMSPEHVARMNEVLAESEEMRRACADLGGRRVMAYRLTNGPGGKDVHWSAIFSDTMRFSLEEEPSPDVLITGDWKRMIRTVEAGRRGEAIDPQVEINGDPEMLSRLGQALEAGRSIATFDVTFPEID